MASRWWACGRGGRGASRQTSHAHQAHFPCFSILSREIIGPPCLTHFDLQRRLTTTLILREGTHPLLFALYSEDAHGVCYSGWSEGNEVEEEVGSRGGSSEGVRRWVGSEMRYLRLTCRLSTCVNVHRVIKIFAIRFSWFTDFWV